MELLVLDRSPTYIPFIVQCTKSDGTKVNPTVDNLIIYEEGGTDATFDSGQVTGSPFDPAQVNSKTGLWGVLVAKSVFTSGKFYIAMWEMTIDGKASAKVEKYFACNSSNFMATGFATSAALAIVDGIVDDLKAYLNSANTELASVPTTTDNLRKMVQFIFEWIRNKKEVTSSKETLYKEDASTKLGEATLSDNGTTMTKGEMGAPA